MRAADGPQKPRGNPVTLTAEPLFVSASLIDRVTSLYGPPLARFASRGHVRRRPCRGVRGFAAAGATKRRCHVRRCRAGRPGCLLSPAPDAGAEGPPAATRAVGGCPVAGPAGRNLAGGFADRFRTAWPFEQCVFVTDGIDPAAFSRQLGLPVSDAPDAEAPEVLRTDARAGSEDRAPAADTLGPLRQHHGVREPDRRPGQGRVPDDPAVHERAITGAARRWTPGWRRSLSGQQHARRRAYQSARRP